MSVLQISNLDFFEAKSVDIDEFSKEYIDWINNSDLLHDKTYNHRAFSNKTFSSNKWILLHDIDQKFHILDFEQFKEILDNDLMTEEDLILLKCWLVSKLMDGYSILGLKKSFKLIKNVLEITNNLNLETVDSKYGNKLLNLLEDADCSCIPSLKEYLCFLDDLGYIDDSILDIINLLDDFIVDKSSKHIRNIPYNKDIIAFKYYLDLFFNDNHPESLKNLYMPILLWWKITMIIPMRPSEFAYKLKRDCLLQIDEKYYLKIDRVKIKDKSKTVGKIPILDKIQITKEIADLIDKYLEITKFDTESKTLISYCAMRHFEKECSNLKLTDLIIWNGTMKGDITSFNREVLQRLINSFYSVVIKGIYKDETIDAELKAGDTRHLAFSSLVMQGLNPIEIAMLGGHRHLHSQESYTGHIEYYIDSEMLDFASNKNIEKSISDRNLVKLIYSKPVICPRFIADCNPTEEGIGYCTLDMLKDGTTCEDVELCMFCSKWWCEPSTENYKKAKAFLETNILSELKQTIEKEEQFLIQLLSNAKTINIDGLLELDKNYEEQLATARLNLKSNADKMIALKQSLLNYTNEN